MSYFENEDKLNIINVALKCNIDIIKSLDNSRVLSKCPFCDDTSGHMYLTIDNNKFKNFYKCHRCGEKGSSISLYAKLNHMTNKEAYIELISDISREKLDISKRIIEKVKKNNAPCEIKNINYLDSVYIEFLNLLSLDSKHLTNLKDRGLDEQTIKRNLYRTLNIEYTKRISVCKKLIELGFELKGIPGFYTDKYNNWSFISRKGILIPMKNFEGKIISLQIRMDDEELLSNKNFKSRYIYFSSYKYNNGTKAIAAVHYIKGIKNSNTISITEGPLKGDIASFFSNESFIAIPGVSTGHSEVINIIKKLNNPLTIICFDMDLYDNVNVKKSLIQLCKKFNENNISFVHKSWKEEYKKNKNLKGIDDLLYHEYKNRV
ncbi:DUF3854 domain-containing protein [Clostridioides sp. ZZV15-6598]|uniref:DUF3854 domain-containing protein n=1 Tax=Clostridioides sp. ZZV15-6598 TaxID=2811501 RepID=UPI001D10D154|nr:DUF3854 domain-containing protein [Clostridioides sp. ZZV15-6598]